MGFSKRPLFPNWPQISVTQAQLFINPNPHSSRHRSFGFFAQTKRKTLSQRSQLWNWQIILQGVGAIILQEKIIFQFWSDL
jgi:hypothetical protein